MYNVTDTYKTLIKAPVRYVGISGAVRLRSGEIVQINDSNIAAGSLSIASKLNRRGDFRPGGVYSSELSVGLTGVAVRTNDLDGAVIRLNFSIYPDNARKPAEAQTVPLGRFYADGSTIKRSGSVVNLKADDALMLFDIPATKRSGTLYELVTGACSSAGVSFSMTQEEFEALPNASAAVGVNTARIQTERDLLMYAGMMTGSFARITRTGELIFVPLSCETDESTHVIIPVREIAGNIRFQTDFSDDTTRIARLFMRRNGGAIYSTLTGTAAGSEKLATLELEENPLMSEMSDDEVKAALNNLLTRLYECLNRVFNAEFTGDPALETGDYVRLRGGLIDTDRGYATGMITSQVWRYHGNHTIRCSMPSSLIYSGEDSPAVMALAADDTPAVYAGDSPPGRVQPKSQIEKRVDALEAGSFGANSLIRDTTYTASDGTVIPQWTISDSGKGGVSIEAHDATGKYAPQFSLLMPKSGNYMEISSRALLSLLGGQCSLQLVGDLFQANIANGGSLRLEEGMFNVGANGYSLHISDNDLTISLSFGSISMQSGRLIIAYSDGSKLQFTPGENGGLYVNGKKVLTE